MTTNDTSTDCHDPAVMLLKSFAITLKPYMYPATIEFSITCATLFIIMWYKIGKAEKNYSLLPTKKNFEDVGSVSMPFTNLFIMLDCTKTAKGLFFGIIIFVGTLLSSILFIVYNSKPETEEAAKLLSEITECVLLVIALILTSYAFVEIRKYYTKVIPQTNMFDIVLEIFSLGGVYAFSVNSLIALFYEFAKSDHSTQDLIDYVLYLTGHKSAPAGENYDMTSELGVNITAALASILSIVQGTIQTLFILECLRRYAFLNRALMLKPARELITALLLTNISLWLFDTLSAKRFDTKDFLIDHFGILKWSIINAFSSPIAIFYRFHSSVCLSDIWYGLYYGEYEEPENEDEISNEVEESV